MTFAKCTFRRLSLLGLLGLGLLLPGASVTRGESAKRAPRPVPPRAEERLVKAVRHELLMLPYYGVFDNLEYRVAGYRVELYGDVVDPVLKSDAERAVKRIEGVEGVDNHIHVLPVSLFDNRIRRREYSAIYRHPAMTKYAIQPVPPIHIIVDHGHVTLVGVVASAMDRNIAYLQANSVPDVFSVSNQLRVER